MKTAIFLGEEHRISFAAPTFKQYDISLTYTEPIQDIHIAADLALRKPYDYIIYDVSGLISDTEEIIQEILRIYRVNESKTILFAPGYLLESELIQAAMAANIRNFVLSVGYGSAMDEFAKCLNGYYDANGRETEQITESPLSKTPSDKLPKSFGIAGACSHIGATTQALQLCKYILYKGYSVAYIELNSNSYIDQCKELYADIQETDDDRSFGRIRYSGIDLYTSDHLNEVKNLPYDFLVYDYGIYGSADFETISFLEKDICIFVGGIKPNEIDFLQQILQQPYYKTAYFALNFVPYSDRADVLDMMCDQADKTIFPPYTPDPFVYSSTNVCFESIFQLKNKNSKTRNPLFKFLWKGRRHGKEI